jgi:predicted RNA binding protein YcfA (HicA-like mRNA interferase family)
MPKLRVLSGKEMCKILAEHGFKEVRRKGSHIIMQKIQGHSTITVPVPDHSEAPSSSKARRTYALIRVFVSFIRLFVDGHPPICAHLCHLWFK